MTLLILFVDFFPTQTDLKRRFSCFTMNDKCDVIRFGLQRNHNCPYFKFVTIYIYNLLTYSCQNKLFILVREAYVYNPGPYNCKRFNS